MKAQFCIMAAEPLSGYDTGRCKNSFVHPLCDGEVDKLFLHFVYSPVRHCAAAAPCGNLFCGISIGL